MNDDILHSGWENYCWARKQITPKGLKDLVDPMMYSVLSALAQSATFDPDKGVRDASKDAFQSWMGPKNLVQRLYSEKDSIFVDITIDPNKKESTTFYVCDRKKTGAD